MSRLNCSMTQQHFTVKSQSVFERHLKILNPFWKRTSVGFYIVVWYVVCLWFQTVWREDRLYCPNGNSHCPQYHSKTTIKKKTHTHKYIHLWITHRWKLFVLCKTLWTTSDATVSKTVPTVLLTHVFLSLKVFRFCFKTVRNELMKFSSLMHYWFLKTPLVNNHEERINQGCF